MLTNKRILLPVVACFALFSLLLLYNFTRVSTSRVKPSQIVVPEYSNIIDNTAKVDQLDLTKQEWESCLEPGETAPLYLSIVIVTRVDNYAG